MVIGRTWSPTKASPKSRRPTNQHVITLKNLSRTAGPKNITHKVQTRRHATRAQLGPKRWTLKWWKTSTSTWRAWQASQKESTQTKRNYRARPSRCCSCRTICNDNLPPKTTRLEGLFEQISKLTANVLAGTEKVATNKTARDKNSAQH